MKKNGEINLDLKKNKLMIPICVLFSVITWLRCINMYVLSAVFHYFDNQKKNFWFRPVAPIQYSA